MMINKNALLITQVQHQQLPFHLLLLADPSEEIVREYLPHSTCFIGKLNDTIVATLVVIELNNTSLEIKNLAVHEEMQSNGFGKQLLAFAADYAHKLGYKTLVIGTGNSSIHQLHLYQKVGFEMVRLVKNHFVQHYKTPIVENTIVCKHLVILEKELG